MEALSHAEEFGGELQVLTRKGVSLKSAFKTLLSKYKAKLEDDDVTFIDFSTGILTDREFFVRGRHDKMLPLEAASRVANESSWHCSRHSDEDQECDFLRLRQVIPRKTPRILGVGRHQIEDGEVIHVMLPDDYCMVVESICERVMFVRIEPAPTMK